MTEALDTDGQIKSQKGFTKGGNTFSAARLGTENPP